MEKAHVVAVYCIALLCKTFTERERQAEKKQTLQPRIEIPSGVCPGKYYKLV